MRKKCILAVAFAALAAAPAGAATISVSTFSVGDYNAALGGFSTVVAEDFEGFVEGNVDDGFSTAVGTFASVGGTGSGGTVTDSLAQGNFAGNVGSKLAIRDGNVYGRTSTTAALSGNATDNKFLDSNDTYGISWAASVGGKMFTQLLLTLTDATDVGATMRISAGGETYSFSGLGNANKQMVLVTFSNAVASANVLFENFTGGGNRKLNDGFSLDDVAVNVSAVPLPAAGLLLLGGLAGLGVAGRRRKA